MSLVSPAKPPSVPGLHAAPRKGLEVGGLGDPDSPLLRGMEDCPRDGVLAVPLHCRDQRQRLGLTNSLYTEVMPFCRMIPRSSRPYPLASR